MKKVLFTATVDSHIELFHLPFLKYFKNNGYEVHVATDTEKKIDFCDKKHEISFKKSPYRIDNLKAIKQLRRIINEEKFDIIHTHTPMGSVVTRLAASRSRKRNGTKVIYTAHGFHFYKGAPLFNWLFFYPVEKLLAKKVDLLITINEEDYQLASKKFKTRVEYVPGVGIDEAKFGYEMTDKEKTALKESLGLNADTIILIYPAEISIRKNQSWLLSSLQSVLKDSNVHLLLPGKQSIGSINRLARDLGIENNVHLLGFRTDIPELLKMADIAVSSSKQEGLPINIVEAMYIGIPIVATDCRGNRDLVKNKRNGFLVSLDKPDEFKTRVIELINNNDLAEKFKKNASVDVEPHLLSNILEKIKNLYNEFM